MKPHIVTTIHERVQAPYLRHWSELLTHKPQGSDRFISPIDRVMDQYGQPFWVAQEYRPASATGWSPAEMAGGLDRTFRLILQRAGRIPQGLIDALQLVPQIASVRPGFVAVARMPQPFSRARVADQASRDAVFLDKAHRITRGDPAIRIAVLDTGVETSHPEFTRIEAPRDEVNIISGHDQFVGDLLDADSLPEDSVGHGTHVAGIALGAGRKMPTGVAPDCTLIPVRVLAAMERDGERFGAGLVDNINQGVKWAVDNGADVINMSLGVRHEGGGLPHSEVIRYALEKGVTVVAASGNDGQNALYYPGALPGVITVGAMSREGGVAGFSTYNRRVQLIAPGEDVYSSYRGDGYAFASGTSHAAPFVAGAVALLKSFVRGLTDGQVKYLLKHTADRLDQRFQHPKAGYGRLNIIDALRLARAKTA